MGNMLEIRNLHAEAGGREILKGVDLTIEEGETCVLFGPNGSGKSTLLSAIMGYSTNRITNGSIIYKGIDITDFPVNKRAELGIGMMMQRPPNVIGVKLGKLIATASSKERVDEILNSAEDFRMENFLDRDVNVGFSGGEIKRSELLQLTAQSPDLILLDEPESGVDLQSIDLIGNKVRDLLYDRVNCRRSAPKKVSALVITHTGQILDYIGADKAYVMGEGRIRCSGRPADLLKKIKTNGYGDCGVCKEVVIPE